MQLDELSELQEVRNALGREEKVVEVKARLKEGVLGENLALINKALEMALELGCQEDSQVSLYLSPSFGCLFSRPLVRMRVWP